MLILAFKPRPAALLDAPTPASVYTLQQQLLSAYREQISWYNRYSLLEAVFSHRVRLPFPDWRAKHVAQAWEKLIDKIPELLFDYTADELKQAQHVLLTQTVVAFCWLVLDSERAVQYRLKDHSRHRLDDDSHARAAGIGRCQ